MQSPSKNSTPFGLSRFVVLALYCLVLCLTGMAVGASDPMRQLLIARNVLPDLSEIELRLALTSILGAGFSSAMIFGVTVGPVMALVGSKAVAISGLIFHCLAYMLWFLIPASKDSLTLLYLGAGLFGLAFQCIISSHLSVGCLFPTGANLAIALIGAGPDVSYLVPQYLLHQSTRLGSVESVVQRYLLYVIIPCICLEALTVPWWPFVYDRRRKHVVVHQPDLEARETSELVAKTARSFSHSSSRASVSGGGLHWHLSVWRQLCTIEFLIFLPLFLFLFLRKKHFSVMIREILNEVDKSYNNVVSSRIVDLYNSVVWAGFIFAIIWGGLVDRVGMLPLMVLSNILAIVYTGLSMVENMTLQYVTVFIFIVQQSFILGQAMAFCVTYFGISTLPVLHGILACSAGIASFVGDGFWAKYIYETLGSQKAASWLVLKVSLLFFLCPLGIWLTEYLRMQKRKALKSKTISSFNQDDSHSVYDDHHKTASSTIVPDFQKAQQEQADFAVGARMLDNQPEEATVWLADKNFLHDTGIIAKSHFTNEVSSCGGGDQDQTSDMTSSHRESFSSYKTQSQGNYAEIYRHHANPPGGPVPSTSYSLTPVGLTPMEAKIPATE